MEELWLILLAAHCYGDFLFQTDWIARNKNRFRVLVLHALIHGVLAYLLFQDWTFWQLPLIVFLIHALIDWGKCRVGDRGKTPLGFATDQTAHVGSLWLIAVICSETGWVGWNGFDGWGWNLILGGAGFCAAVLGAGFFIGEVASKMMAENLNLTNDLSGGLQEGGKQIGRLERALIFTLIAIGQPAGIGFLVAAKSILRFEEAKKQNLAEYVLIGTLWSFGLAIALSWLTFEAMELSGGR